MNQAVSSDAAWRQLHHTACAPYKRAGRFAWHFARGKLGRDPVFRQLFEQGLLGSAAFARVVDIGCGQGLLASLLDATRSVKAQWPSKWIRPPQLKHYTGIELMPRDVARANAALAGLENTPVLICQDMCEALLPACDLVVILDVLHYVDIAAQDRLLERVRDALAAGHATRVDGTGRLLLRVGDAANQRGFAISQWVDRTVTRIRGHRVSPTWGRPLDAWVGMLERLGFAVQSLPMSQGTPFANVLLVADLKP